MKGKLSHFQYLEQEWSKLQGKDGQVPVRLLKKTACPVCRTRKEEQLFIKKGLRFVRCQRCQHVFINPRLKDEALAEHFNRSVAWDIWAKQVLPDPQQVRIDRIKYQDAIRHIKKRTLNRKGIRLLDVGCSSGIFLDMAQKEGWQVKGVEPSAAAVRYAKDTFGLDVHHGGFDTYRSSARFDVITFWASLEYHLDVREAFKKADQLLVPGGLMLVFISGNSNSLMMRMLQQECVGFVFNRIHSFNPLSLDFLAGSFKYKLLLNSSYVHDTDIIENYLSYKMPYTKPRIPLFNETDRKKLQQLMAGNIMGYKFLSIYRKGH